MYGFGIKVFSVINDPKNFKDLPILIFHSSKNKMVSMEQFELASKLFDNKKNLLTYQADGSQHARMTYKRPALHCNGHVYHYTSVINYRIHSCIDLTKTRLKKGLVF